MRTTKRAAPLAALVMACWAGLAVTAAPPALAHTQRKVAGFSVEVGWLDEPIYAGFKNGVDLSVHDAKDNPVADLGDQLQVEVIFGTARMGPVSFEPDSEKPGRYRAGFIPTRPGDYTFHLVGKLGNQKVDESFAKKDGLEEVTGTADVQFPVKDPSLSETATRLGRVSSRVDSLMHESGRVKSTTTLALVLAGAGLLAGLAALARRAKP